MAYLKSFIFFFVISLIANAILAQTDQTIVYGTFLGGSLDESPVGKSLAPLSDGGWIIFGSVRSQNIFTTPDALIAQQPSVNNQRSHYFAIFSPEGEVSYASYWGGSGFEIEGALASNGDGYFALAGRTESNDFPLSVNPDNAVYEGVGMGFVSSFSPGGALLWSTFFGGAGEDRLVDVAISGSGEVYVGGITSTDGLGTEGVYQPNLPNPPSFAPVLVKYSAEGERMWTTYYHFTNGVVGCSGIALSPDGETLYAVGNAFANGTEGIELDGFQPTYGGGVADGWLAAFSATDGTLLWSTFYGGPGEESGLQIAVANSGQIYIATETTSTSHMATPGAWQSQHQGGVFDFSIAAVSPSGQLLWSTYFGGLGFEPSIGALHTDANDLLFLGATRSEDGLIHGNALFPVANLPPSPMSTNTTDILAKWRPDGSLHWATYLTDNHPRCSAGRSVVSLGAGRIAVSQAAIGNLSSTLNCTTLPVAGGFQQSYGGGESDMSIIVFEDQTLSVPSASRQPLVLYPNPAHESVVLQWPAEDAGEVGIFDLHGRQVSRVSAFRPGASLPLAHLQQGVYIVSVQVRDEVYRQKLVISR